VAPKGVKRVGLERGAFRPRKCGEQLSEAPRLVGFTASATIFDLIREAGGLLPPESGELRPRHAANDLTDGPGGNSRRANQPAGGKTTQNKGGVQPCRFKIVRQPKKEDCCDGALSSAWGVFNGNERRPWRCGAGAGLVLTSARRRLEVGRNMAIALPGFLPDDEEHRRGIGSTEIVAG